VRAASWWYVGQVPGPAAVVVGVDGLVVADVVAVDVVDFDDEEHAAVTTASATTTAAALSVLLT